ncbi:MAG: AbrB family transcriptional regulator [Solimonas sp.]
MPRRFATVRRWLALLALTVPLTAALHALGLPAAFLLGPLLAAIAVAAGGAELRTPPLAYTAAQALLGCMVASIVVAVVPASFHRAAPLLIAAVALPIGLSAVLGYWLSRWRLLPATTGVWGTLPGGAGAMVVMGEAFGADPRLVAFMQYLRVLCVAVVASLIAYALVDGPVAAAHRDIVWFPPPRWPALATTALVAIGGAWLGQRLRVPSGALLGPMALGLVVRFGAHGSLQLPQWLMALAYAMLGWTVGLRFTRRALVHAARLLPAMLAGVLALLLVCALLAWLLTLALHIDGLTAYLALSPGGLDTAAIIAAATHVDLPLVMLLQTARLLIVLVAGPGLARFAARRAQAHAGALKPARSIGDALERRRATVERPCDDGRPASPDDARCRPPPRCSR